jgi:hypothetical protein
VSEYIPYYGRLDYPSVIARQLERIAAVRSNLEYPLNRIGLARYFNAVKTLYMISPRSVRERVGPPRDRSLEALDEYVMRLRDELERAGLIAVRYLETGRPDLGGGGLADVLEEGEAGV